MKKIRTLILITLATLPAGMAAQTQPQDTTLNRTVVVEQEYNPNIRDADKINAVPPVEPPVVKPKAVEYDNRLQPLEGDIPAEHMQPYAGQTQPSKATPGYLSVGYGNYGNLDIRANYLFSLSPKDRLNLTFHMDGMDGTLDLPGSMIEWDAYYYRTHAAIDYRHAFRRIDMDIAGHFDLSNFNFLPEAADRKQKFTAGDFHLGLASTTDELPLQFQAETNLMIYERQHEPGLANAQEVMARTRAHVTGSITDEQTIGVKAHMDNVFYHNTAFRDYTSISLNPYFHFQNEAWRLHLGVHADLALGFGQRLRVSPDVCAAYHFARSAVYLQAKGDRHTNDFRRLERFTPYGQTTAQPDATYEQLNAAIGLKTGTLGGLHLHLYGGYQNLKDDLYAAFPSDSDYTLLLGTWDTDNLYAGAEISYDYRDLIAFTAQGTYRRWSASEQGEDLYVLAFKPVLEADARIDVHPISPLRVHIGYRSVTRDRYNGVKADPVADLYLGGSYEFLKILSAHLRIGNLLGKDYQYYPGYPAEGFNFTAGASIRF